MIHVNNFSNGALNPVLAYLMSCVGCFLGLRCTTRARVYSGAARARWLTAAALAIATTGIWVMHFIAMLGFTIPGQPIRYNVPVTILSMLIAVIVVGIGTFIVGFSQSGTRPLVAGGLIIGIGVACMHYLGMAALHVQAAPGLTVSTSATASAGAFLLPLILGLSSVGFIFSAVIALSPTAAEIVEEDELMKRIGQSQAGQYEQQPGQARPAVTLLAQPGPEEPGSLFRPRRPGDPADQALAGTGTPPGRPHRRTLPWSQEQSGWLVRRNETTRSLAWALSSQGSTGHCFHAVSPL